MEQSDSNKISITLVGESTGSQSVCIHIVSSLSVSLFHAGITKNRSRYTASHLRDNSLTYSTGNNLASPVGCNMTNSGEQLACLRTVNGTLLLAAIANISILPTTCLAFKNQEKVGGISSFSLIVDEVEIPVHPLKGFLSRTVNQISITMGANHDEFLLCILYEQCFHSLTSLEDCLTCILSTMAYNNG